MTNDGWRLIKQVKFRPGSAVGMVYLENPKNEREKSRVIGWFEDNGVTVDRSHDADYLLVKPSSGLMAAVNRYAKDRGHLAVHDAALELIQLGLGVAYPNSIPTNQPKPSAIARFVAKMRKAA